MIVMGVAFFMVSAISREEESAVGVSWYFNMCDGNGKAQAAQTGLEECAECSAGSEFPNVRIYHPFWL